MADKKIENPAGVASGFLTMSCPVCGGSEYTLGANVFDDRYGEPGLYGLAKCSQCHHLATAPRLSETDLPALYGTYYPRKSVAAEDVRSEAKAVLRLWARLRRWWMGVDNQGQYTVHPGELMLDIGCGSGLSLLEAQAMGAQARGVEADPNVRRIADELGVQVHIGSLYDDPFPGERFDLVVLNQVIEHVPDPDQTLVRLRSRLQPGGRVVLVFPNVRSCWCRLSGASWINWHVPYHLHHFSRDGFTQMAGRCGYRVKAVRTITPNLWTILQFRASRLNIPRGLPSPLWAVSSPQAAEIPDQAVPPARKSLRRVLRRVVLASLMLPLALMNRTIDALGWGDSLMVEIVPVEQA
jgi:SAM-dependent methyltransferase